MKIGILGTRGIPNHYGGFEQFAEQLSSDLVARGHEVWVYNSSKHPYKASIYKGVRLVHCFDPEDYLGTAGQFIYDLGCIIDSRKRNFDVLLQLGYTSSAIWHWLLPKKACIVTNMDGLEWKRTKYGKLVKRFLKYSERLAAQTSPYLVADSLGIQAYLLQEYNKKSTYIAYGAKQILQTPSPTFLTNYQVQAYQYALVIARMEPENNIETIIQGFIASKSTMPLLLIGNYNNGFGMYLKEKYGMHACLRWLGAIYQMEVLDALRWHAALYFHGHSVGGTNPSLLEAMASKAAIIAHKNPFNQSILQDNALYFSTANDISAIVAEPLPSFDAWKAINFAKIATTFSPAFITNQYENLFLSCLQKS